LARTIYTRCIYSILGREITKYTVIYGVNTAPPLNHCFHIIFRAKEMRNQYLVGLKEGVRNR